MLLYRTLVVATLVGLSGAAMSAQATSTPMRVAAGEATISGRVIDRNTQRPIANTVVTLSAQVWEKVVRGQEFPKNEIALVTVTNAAGDYVFDAIGAGMYQLSAKHSDYPEMIFGTSEPSRGGSLVQVSSGKQRYANHDFALVRGGSVAGTISGADGRPMNGVAIRLIPLTPSTGPAAFGLVARTDQRGGYTVSNIPPGRYHVQATWAERDAQTDAPTRASITLFPGVSSSRDAIDVEVGAGAAIRNIDMVLAIDELMHLGGQVLRGAGEGRIEMELRESRGTKTAVRVAQDGTFALRLRPGRYTLLARAQVGDGLEAASLTVELTGDMTGLLMTLAPAGRIAGRVVTDDGSPITDRLYVLAVLSDGSKEIDQERRDRVEVNASGGFELSGLYGHRVLRVVGLSEEWTVDDIFVGKMPVASLSLEAGETIDNVTILLKRR